MIYLVFETEEAAQLALDEIWFECQPTSPSITTAWAIKQQRSDGRWIFPKPSDKYMTYVTDFTEEEFSESWLPEGDIDV